MFQIFDSALNLLGRRRFDAVFRPLVYDLFIAGEEKASFVAELSDIFEIVHCNNLRILCHGIPYP